MAMYSNHSLTQKNRAITRVILMLHGIKRNGDVYYSISLDFLRKLDLDPAQTLLLTPNFMTERDALALPSMALWRSDDWMQGNDSTHGQKGISSLSVLDDTSAHVSSGQFPSLEEIMFMGMSAGGQLLQRYAVLNNHEDALKLIGIKSRYIIASPSSYLYLDNNRPADSGDFACADAVRYPGYDDWRYGLGSMPPFGLLDASGTADGQTLFKRYAARDVTYCVGSADNDPDHVFLDKACGARLQGSNRLERQGNYVRYLQFLARKWRTPVHHSHFLIPGAGHNAAAVLCSDTAVKVTGRAMKGDSS